ncbi:hypothetical protein EJ02DRAFT_489686 [Clathrospora elynae]|uniref:Uncharacterized protein n=1 Tax=Clathrospora elynae TaxID=706981 RepID=A0A6A5SRL1_9PLEO|nr:hypothetical protein EJ02DRAFT_489686 [Clathrospora elynae]
MDANSPASDLVSTQAAIRNGSSSTSKASCTSEGNQDYVRTEVFRVLNLPGELHNHIYGYLLTDMLGLKDFVDPIIFINDLSRRKEHREAHDSHLASTGLPRKPIQLATRHHMLNFNDINIAHYQKRFCGLPPLLETNIPRVCRQTNTEGSGVMWKENAFAIAVPIENTEASPLSLFPAGLDTPRIQYLRLEIQIRGRRNIQKSYTCGSRH